MSASTAKTALSIIDSRTGRVYEIPTSHYLGGLWVVLASGAGSGSRGKQAVAEA